MLSQFKLKVEKHEADFTPNKISVISWTHVADIIEPSSYFKLMRNQTSAYS